MIKRRQCWVSEEFKRKLNVEAAKAKKSILEFTDDLARIDAPFEKLFKRSKKDEKIFPRF